MKTKAQIVQDLLEANHITAVVLLMGSVKEKEYIYVPQYPQYPQYPFNPLGWPIINTGTHAPITRNSFTTICKN